MKITNSQIDKSLSKRVTKSGLWLFNLKLVSSSLGFIRIIILARLLSPQDFGLLGIAMVTLTSIETFFQTGFTDALIQKKGDITAYLDTAWTVSVLRGGGLFLVLYSFAPTIASFFNSPDAASVIKVLALTTLINGARNVGMVFFKKDLEFNRLFSFEFIAVVFDMVISIMLACILKNVWALVWGSLAGNLTRLVLSYSLHPYRPNFFLGKKEFNRLFSFGKWILGSQIILLLANQGDDLVVSKLLGLEALGFYQMAYMVSNLPTTHITHIISQVTFPAYSKLQKNIPKLKQGYLKVLKMTCFISIPLGVGTILLSNELTRIIFSEQWLPMTTAIKVLSVCGVLRSVGATIGPVLHGIGTPSLLTKLSLIKLAALTVLIYPFTMEYGIVGTSVSLLLATMISNPIAVYHLLKITDCGLTEFFKPVFFPFFSAGIMFILLFKLKLHYPVDGFLELMAYVFAGSIIYFSVIYLIDKIFDYNIKDILWAVVNTKK